MYIHGVHWTLQPLTMLERQQSSRNLLQKHNHNIGHVKPASLQRQKNRSLLLRRQSSSLLTKHLTLKLEPQVNNRVKQLVRQNTRFGLILNYLNNNKRLASVTDNNDNSVCEELDNNNYLPSNTEETYQDLTELLQNEEIAAKIINKDEFSLGRVLGAGGFGSVYLGTFKGETVAVKIMHKFTKNPAAQVESFKAELHVLQFKHPNIIKTLAATHIDQFDEGAWVVMEYVSNMSLSSLINDPSETLDANRRLKYSYQIASALAYAHKHKVAHLDLKPANILISTKDDCKVGDFGCSQQCAFETGIVSPTNRSVLTGTYAYRAPELLKGQPPTFRADVYSYGITLWQMRSRETPFGSQNQHVVIFGVVAKGLRPPNPDPTDDDPFELSYKELYEQCWVACPLDRPSSQDLVDLLNIWRDNL